MRAIEVCINDQKVTVAGVPGMGQLVALMTSGNCNDTPVENVDGLDDLAGIDNHCSFLAVYGSHPNARLNRLIWIDREPLSIGDEIKLRFVDSDTVDPPAKEEQVISKDKLRYELIKREYFELKEKFENDR